MQTFIQELTFFVKFNTHIYYFNKTESVRCNQKKAVAKNGLVGTNLIGGQRNTVRHLHTEKMNGLVQTERP